MHKLEGKIALVTGGSSAVPAGRLGRAEEVAKAIVFLASDEASYVTGIEFFVDGGLAQV